MKKIILNIYVILLNLSSPAQQNKILTDRPSNAIVPYVAEQSYFQTETGLHLNSYKKINNLGRDNFFSHPQLLLKYGIFKNLELRTLTEFSSLHESYVNGDYRLSGISNVQFGAKYFILDKKKWRPAIGIVAHYSFNTLRTNGFSKDTINGANFRISFENDITKKIVLVYNGGITIERFGARNTYVYSISPRFDIGEKFNYFIEFYGNAWKKRKPFNSLHSGLSYFVNNNLKFDASFGLGFSKGFPDRFFSVGASCRFKTKKY